jgi:predicted NAD-dependent protein-ADP-ribosyltransferase YbiA (DUF1768 family)
MDISSKSGYPAGSLSNFAPHKFVVDGVQCSSMEGFLQSLKFKNPDMQIEVCKLVGLAAKKKGSGKRWQESGVLYWRGVEIKRDSDQYQQLLNRAYEAMFEQSEGFRKALKASGNAVLTHAMGRTDARQTVLTRSEFCSRLTKLRNRLNNEGDKSCTT